MSCWNEDNFLEKISDQVRRQRGAERGPCPDAETLCSALKGEAPAVLKELVTEHLKHCPECADLRNRLLNFEAGASPEPEVVWQETRKRLDNWLESFLRAEEAKLRVQESASSRRRSPLWESFLIFFNSRRFLWGLGAVALAVLIGDAMLVLELRLELPNLAQITARSAAPKPQAAPASSAGVSNQAGEIEVGRAPGVSTSPSQKRIARTSEAHGRPQVTEHAPVVAYSGGLPASQDVTQPSTPTVNLPPVVEEATQTATPPAPVTAAGPPRNSSVGASTGIRRAAGPVFAPAAIRPPAGPRPQAAMGPLPSLRLDPSAHLLVALSSAKQMPDGSFEFRGTLLLPVAHAGPVPLDRGVEVVGAGETREGRTSLAVMEFVVQGARYILKDGSGAMKAQTPGTGGAVQFERSQILEMWPMSPLIYEKAPDATAQPNPQQKLHVLGAPPRG